MAPSDLAMTVHLYLGDCLDVMAAMDADSVDSIVTDPPYGLSSGESRQGVSQRVYDALLKIGFPSLYQRYAEAVQGGDLASIPLTGAALRCEHRAVGEQARICVPESAIDLKGNAVVNPEVYHANKAASERIADGALSGEGDAHVGQFLGDFILQLGDMDALGVAGDMGDSGLAEAFFGGFAVPIFTSAAPSLPGLSTDSRVVIVGDYLIGDGHDALCQAACAPCIVTLPRAVNTLMLRFDLRGRPRELLATGRADYLATVGEFGGAQLVRAFPTTGGLASMAQPHRVRFIVPTADGADTHYWLQVWCPPTDDLVTIIPQGGFMGKDWDSSLPDPAVWQAALRVAKPGAHLLAFGGTRTHHRLMCAIEDAGWEIRDVVMWVYSTGFPKSHDVSKAIDKADYHCAGSRGGTRGRDRTSGVFQYRDPARSDVTAPATPDALRWQGWGTALKPAYEPVIVARKPLVGTVAANVLEYGTGAINIDASRVEYVNEEPPDLEHWRKTSGGWKNTSKAGVVPNDNSKGRWPANLIHDGSDEVTALMPQGASPSGPVRQGGRKSVGGIMNATGDDRDGYGVGYADSGSAARFFYCAKASKSDRDEGLEEMEERGTAFNDIGFDETKRNRQPRNNTARNFHPTVKPTALMRWLVRLVTRPGGVVLDPFMGSGSTGKAARLEGFDFVGIELDAEYLEIARRRIDAVEPEPVQDTLL